MRLGLIARADIQRGLGRMTSSAYEHLAPAKVLVADVSHNSPYAHSWEHYGADALRIGHLEMADREDDLRSWLDGLDVLLTFETPYHYGLYDLAREMGVRSVCCLMPEFWRHDREPELPRPDVAVAPTPWMLERFAADIAVLPWPVDRSHFAFRRRGVDHVRFLHIAGHRAIYDRNGTQIVSAAWRSMPAGVDLIIRSQSAIPRLKGPPCVLIRRDEPDPRCLYLDADVLVLPRRFGGQCLPMLEALSAGMPVIGTDRDPERWLLPADWLVAAKPGRPFDGQPGPVPIEHADPAALRARMLAWAHDPGLVQEASIRADQIAQAFSWQVLGPTWRGLLEEAAR